MVLGIFQDPSAAAGRVLVFQTGLEGLVEDVFVVCVALGPGGNGFELLAFFTRCGLSGQSSRPVLLSKDTLCPNQA